MKPRTLALAFALATLPCSMAHAEANLTISGPDGYLEVESRMQVVYSLPIPANDNGTAPEAEPNEAPQEPLGTGSVRIKQARLNLHGVYLDRFDYKLTAELGPSHTAPLRDARLGIRLASWLRTDIGQFKVPYSRNRLASGEHTLFVERPAMAYQFVPGRDIGVMADLHGPNRHLRFRTGAFTGRGQNMTEDDDRNRPLLAARLDWTSTPTSSTAHRPTTEHPRPALALGANVAWSDDGEVGPGGPIDSIDGRKLLYGTDFAAAYHRFWMSLEVNAARFTPRDTSASSYHAVGFLAQAAWFVAPLRVEPAIRYDALDPNTRTGNDRQQSVSLGLNAYPLADVPLKLMLDYVHHLPVSETHTQGWTNDTLEVMIQFVLR